MRGQAEVKPQRLIFPNEAQVPAVLIDGRRADIHLRLEETDFTLGAPVSGTIVAITHRTTYRLEETT